jgi:hypothetical protein
VGDREAVTIFAFVGTERPTLRALLRRAPAKPEQEEGTP